MTHICLAAARTLKGPATGTKQLSKRAQRGNRLRGLDSKSEMHPSRQPNLPLLK